MAQVATAALAALVLCSAPAGLAAATPKEAGLPDPTRPPAALLAPAAGAAAPSTEAPQLQSVVISEGRRGAVISGQYVALGGRIGEARLARVEAHGVVLRGPAGDITLPLYPAVRKQPAQAGPEVRENAPGGPVPPRRQEKQP